MKFRKLACTVLAGAAVLGLAACGNSGGSKDAAKSGGDGAKTEITWWAFPVFTQEKLVTVLELMKNQSSKRLKKQTQI
ncbi:N-acetylneuraminate-binding protein [Streptococcus pneumoniae 2070335]|nr:sugar ABC transporter, sugar-binding domain protein [Streptococcus pneumoniae GA41410]EHE28730.1 sugar ABC transporter, sugar-binding domain protein [Streptococcus pneumoniae GA47283]EJG43221.1 N-acetylneuraminate-binding protein [Streptococcus pneumoniae 2070335]